MSEVTIKLSEKDIEAIATSVALKLKKDLKNEPRVYSITEASAILKCHRNTIINHIDKKLIKATRKGRNWFITEEELNNYIKGI